MKYAELEDGAELVSRTELREVMISIHDEILEIKKDILGIKTEILGIKGETLGIRGEINKLRNSLWLNVAVPSLTLIVSLVIHYIVR